MTASAESAEIGIRDLAHKPDGYFGGQRPDMLRYIPSSSKTILEVGCAAGLFGRTLRQELGAEVWGVELEPTAAALAVNNLDKVLVGDIQVLCADLPDGYFDCITFNDVLEHLYDPYTVLCTLKAKLTPNGVIVASIPNIRYYKILYKLLFEKQWRYEDSGVLDKTHIRFFTQASLYDMFNDLDFNILKIEGVRPTRKVKIRLLGWLTFGWLSDIMSCQFACVVTPKTST